MVCAVLGGVYFFHRADHEVRSFVQAKLAEAYPHLSVSVGSARILQGEGIQIRSVSIVAPIDRQRNSRSELAYVDELFVACKPTLPNLVQGRLQADQIIIRRMQFSITRDSRGKWDVAQLFPLPAFGGQSPPPVIVENAVVAVHDHLVSPAAVVSLRQVNMRIAAELTGNRVLTNRLRFSGSLASDHFQETTIDGWLDPGLGLYQLKTHVKNLRIAPELQRVLPAECAPYWQHLADLRADANLDIQISRLDANEQHDMELTGEIANAKLQDARLQYPLRDVRARFAVDRRGWQIQNMSAKYGQADVNLSVAGSQFHPRTPLRINAAFQRLPIHPRLVELLPASLKSEWSKFQPSGVIDGSVEASFDGTNWKCETAVKVSDLSLLYHKFPYPITNANGEMNFKEGVIDFQLRAMASSRPITIHGAFANPGPAATGWCQIRSEQPIPINENLLAALPPKGQQLFRDLQARGWLGFHVRLHRDRPVVEPLQIRLAATVSDGWVHYNKFPYPIGQIEGTIGLQEGNWSFHNLRGVNDNCTISCRGIWNAKQQDRLLKLEFAANRVPLDDELRQALSPQLQQKWQDIKPHGTLDHLEVRLVHSAAAPQPHLDISFRQLPAQAELYDGGIQIEPIFFPYLLRRVTGEAHFRDGVLTVQNFSAQHGRTRMHSNLTASIPPGGMWRVNLTNFAATLVHPEPELVAALPKPMQEAIRRTSLGGHFAVDGAFSFSRTDRQSPVAAAWDLTLNLDQAKFHTGVPLTNVYGEVALRGRSNGREFSMSGQLNLDSLMHREIQFTRIRGPVWLNSSQLVLGSKVPRIIGSQQAAPVHAKVHGGTVQLDAHVRLGEIPEYTIQAHMTNANLSSLARDLNYRTGRLSGQISGELTLSGSTRGRDSLHGEGMAQLENANVGDAPLVLALIQRLSSGRPDTSMFSRSQMRFRVQGPHIYFDPIELAGDTITLKGQGDMSLDRRINLDFYTIVGREQLWAPIVRPILGEASRQFLLVHVDGTLDNPRTTQTVLPALNETLQQLFPELTKPSAEDPALRRILRSARARLPTIR